MGETPRCSSLEISRMRAKAGHCFRPDSQALFHPTTQSFTTARFSGSLFVLCNWRTVPRSIGQKTIDWCGPLVASLCLRHRNEAAFILRIEVASTIMSLTNQKLEGKDSRQTIHRIRHALLGAVPFLILGMMGRLASYEVIPLRTYVFRDNLPLTYIVW